MTEKNNALVPMRGVAPLALNTIQDVMTLAETLAKSGYFTDARTAAQAVVKILAGRELGFQTIASMVGVHIIDGKPSMGAHLLAAKIKGSDRYDYEIVTGTRDVCELEFWERSLPQGGDTRRGCDGWVKKKENIRFTLKEATESGLTISEKTGQPKRNWRVSSDDMLFARCISKGYRRYAPDLTGGVVVYDPDELDAVSVDVAVADVPLSREQSLIALQEAAEYEAAVQSTNGTPALPAPTTPAEEPRPNPSAPPLTGTLTDSERAEMIDLAKKHNRVKEDTAVMLKVIGVTTLAEVPRAKADWLRQALTHGLTPQKQVDRIAALVQETGMPWDDFRARLQQRFGTTSIAYLLPSQADQVEEGMKRRKAEAAKPAA